MAVKHNAEPSSRRSGLVIASLFVLFVVALFLRAYWNLDAAVQDGQFVLSAGSDPYYHKRAIDYIQSSGFQTLIDDPMLNYPYGAINPNPPLYEWSVAVAGSLLAPFFSGTDTMTAEQVATWYAFLWSPAIYGALTLIPIYFIGKALFNRRAGLLAALFWTISTSSIDTTGLGSADHDPAYMLFVALGFLFYIKAIEQFKGDGHWVASWSNGSAVSSGLRRFMRERRLGVMYSLLAGVSTGAVALIWKGFPYVLGIFFAYAALQMVLDHWRNKDSTGIFIGTLLAMLVGVVMAAPYYVLTGLGNFLAPGWFLTLAFLVAGLVLVPTRDLPTILVMPAAAIAAVVGAIVAILALPTVANSLLGPIIYFKRTALYETIAEAHPADFSTLVFSVGPLPYFLALAGFIMLAMGLRKHPARAGLFALVWAAIAVYMATSAVRFVFNALPVIAVFAGFGMARLLDWLDYGRIRRSIRANSGDTWQGVRKGTNGWHIAGALGILFLLVVPNVMLAADAALPATKENEIATETESEFVRDWMTKRFGAYGQGFLPDYWQDGLNWLDRHDANITEPSERPAFLAWWDYGHWAIYVGQHPTVADNFQNGYEFAANFLLAQNETHATQLLAARLMGPMSAAEAEAVLAANGVADPAQARAQLAKFEYVDGIDLQTAVAIVSDLEEATDKSIRYFTTDVRMLPYDNPQTQGFIEQSSIFYAPVTLKGDDTDAYVTHEVNVNGGWRTNDQYREIASDPIRRPVVNGERYTFQPAFFNSMYWRGYIGTEPQQAGPVQGDVVLNAINQPAPGKDLTHWRLVYQNDGLRTLEYFPGALVRGTVTEEGDPLSNVTLTAYDDAGRLIMSGFTPEAQAQFDPSLFNVPHGKATTNAQGEFEIVAPFALEGGVVTIVATRADGTELGRSTLPITREDANTGAEFTTSIVAKKGNVEGLVFEDADGDGAYDATNDTLATNVTVSIGGINATTGPDGRYSIERVSSGRQTVSVDSARFEPAEADRTVFVRPDNTTTHDIALVPKPVNVTGFAYADVDADEARGDEEGASFAALTFAPDESVEGNTAETSTAFTASDGGFTVLLVPGTYVATGQTTVGDATYTLEQQFEVVEGEPLSLDLRFTPASE